MLLKSTGTVFEKYQPLAAEVLADKDGIVLYGGSPLLDGKTYQGIPIYYPGDRKAT
jgi:hypothetical protein